MHIVLASDEDECADEPLRPTAVESRWELVNRGLGLHTTLTLFEDGLLRHAQTRRGKSTTNDLLDVKYLDSQPSRIRFLPKRFCLLTIGLGVLAGACGLLTLLGLFTKFTLPLTILSTTFAIVSSLICAYRASERFEFYTLNGRACVLTLAATPGCFRQLRMLVPKLEAAIENVRSNVTLERNQYLRKEIGEHYRLEKDGVISDEVRFDCTKRILNSFG